MSSAFGSTQPLKIWPAPRSLSSDLQHQVCLQLVLRLQLEQLCRVCLQLTSSTRLSFDQSSDITCLRWAGSQTRMTCTQLNLLRKVSGPSVTSGCSGRASVEWCCRMQWTWRARCIWHPFCLSCLRLSRSSGQHRSTTACQFRQKQSSFWIFLKWKCSFRWATQLGCWFDWSLLCKLWGF